VLWIAQVGPPQPWHAALAGPVPAAHQLPFLVSACDVQRAGSNIAADLHAVDRLPAAVAQTAVNELRGRVDRLDRLDRPPADMLLAVAGQHKPVVLPDVAGQPDVVAMTVVAVVVLVAVAEPNAVDTLRVFVRHKAVGLAAPAVQSAADEPHVLAA
jgi:hypothetical protein